MAKPLYIIKHDGQGSGGFLAPPGHPFHEYTVVGYWGGRVKPVNGPDLIASLDYLIEDEDRDVPAGIKAQAKRIMDSAELACSEAWVRSVYGYFRHSYSPDGKDRNVSHALTVSGYTCACGAREWSRGVFQLHLNRALKAMLRLRAGYGRYRKLPEAAPGPHYRVKPAYPPERHLGYLMVKSYFPEHEPRLDLIADPGRTGSWPCDKCGQRVQYEARKDTWCVVTSGMRWTYDPDCPEGGHHEVAPAAPEVPDVPENAEAS